MLVRVRVLSNQPTFTGRSPSFRPGTPFDLFFNLSNAKSRLFFFASKLKLTEREKIKAEHGKKRPEGLAATYRSCRVSFLSYQRALVACFRRRRYPGVFGVLERVRERTHPTFSNNFFIKNK